jgi:hypothetical protein
MLWALFVLFFAMAMGSRESFGLFALGISGATITLLLALGDTLSP